MSDSIMPEQTPEPAKNSKSGIGTGSVSLILIFAVLCLTIFTLLTLSSAKAEHDTSTKTAESIAAYYAADAKAEIVLASISAELKNKSTVPTMVNDIEISTQTENGINTISYTIPMDDSQIVSVILQHNSASGTIDILKWQIEMSAEWEAFDDFNVWLD